LNRQVSALFVETDGAYFGLPDVDPWDITRDAREYAGPNPVVAHPPCNKWSPLAYINQKRLPGYRIGDDGGCFTSALAAVRKFGGVLEHPAQTLAWAAHQLPRPQRGAWSFPIDRWAGRVTEVDQGRYGHRARKRTWLYVVSPALYLPQLDWEPAESSVIVSGFLHGKGTDESRRVRPKEASATTPAFRELLLELARNAHISQEVAA
jgi:hypothetical protein